MAKILFICDPLHIFKINTDTTMLFLISASNMGHQVFICQPQEIYASGSSVIAISHLIKLLTTDISSITDQHPWYKEQDIQNHKLQDFDAIFVRKDPPFDIEYYYLTCMLSLAAHSCAKIINDGQVLRDFNEKLSILYFPDLIPDTIVSRDKQVLLNFLEQHQECVVKPLDLMGGRGIFKVSLHDVNYQVILESSTNYYTQTVMLQKFIPEVIYGDKRIFIVDGVIIDYYLARIPPKNQIRGNIGAGGTGEVHQVSDEDKLLFAPVAKWLKQHNIIFAGIDVIANKLTEINITSPTGARQIMHASGINIPQLILQIICS